MELASGWGLILPRPWQNPMYPLGRRTSEAQGGVVLQGFHCFQCLLSANARQQVHWLRSQRLPNLGAQG